MVQQERQMRQQVELMALGRWTWIALGARLVDQQCRRHLLSPLLIQRWVMDHYTITLAESLTLRAAHQFHVQQPAGTLNQLAACLGTDSRGFSVRAIPA
jgi:hypothetical protein